MIIPVITDADAMLTLLRVDAANRAVVYFEPSDDDDGRPCVAEVNGRFRALRVLGWLSNDGSAKTLCNAAFDACLAAARGDNTEAYRSLPLVYGPYCGTWVLSEHPAAFTDDPAAPSESARSRLHVS